MDESADTDWGFVWHISSMVYVMLEKCLLGRQTLQQHQRENSASRNRKERSSGEVTIF